MTKIEALEKTIYNLENDLIKYRWIDYNNCNCGVLARSIIGLDKDPRACGLGKSPSIKGNGASGEFFCMTTGLPIPLVFQSVKDAGFTFEEMVNLETLDDDKILQKAGLDRYEREFERKSDLIKYLKAWVEILKEEKMTEEREVKRSVARDDDAVDEVGKHKDITKKLAVLPVDEKPDLKFVGRTKQKP